MRQGGRGALKLKHQIVDVAVVPILARFEGPDDRMADLSIMGGGVPQRRLVAAADMPSDLAHAEMDPIPAAEGEAVDAPVAGGHNVLDLIKMRTDIGHRSRSSRFAATCTNSTEVYEINSGGTPHPAEIDLSRLVRYRTDRASTAPA